MTEHVEEGADIREIVRQRYAAAAKGARTRASCCGDSVGDSCRGSVFGDALYGSEETDGAPQEAVAASLGCGVPTAVADLHEGETVLDLGSGAGADVLISARRVGPSGRAIGLDMTDEMLTLARENAERVGASNVEFVKGHIEEIPLADASVDVVISNCVINLSGDKPAVLREAARVLRPGGRLAVSDVIADPDMDEASRSDMQQWTGCVAGALTREEFEQALGEAGLVDVEIRETHRVHEHAAAAIVRAVKPSETCCPQAALGSCCESSAKAECCGEPTSGAPSSCGCSVQ
ncbi:MAG TPA: arsenite methyltransferase [Gaiellales bacterium]|jgi:SAM-dependent methyltransferase|nr:arsenite methyltransferase [Gaiellales bacterium]